MARFFQLCPGLEAQYWLELTGERAEAMKDIAWPEKHFEKQNPDRRAPNGVVLPATLRLYATAEVSPKGLAFTLPATDGFDFARLQFRRAGARVAAIRSGAVGADARLMGFGRPLPKVTDDPEEKERMSHQDYSLPYVDRRPGAKYVDYRGEEMTWVVFDPVYLKAKMNSGETIVVAVTTTWSEDRKDLVFVECDSSPADVPEKLAAFVFSERQATTPSLAKVSDFTKEFGTKKRR